MTKFYDTLKNLVLLCAFFCITGNALAQQYVSGTWYSLYDNNTYNKSTAIEQTLASNLSVFIPTDDEVLLDSYMTVYQSSSLSQGTYPKGYTINVGNASVNISASEASSVITQSVSGKWFKTYSYSYSWLNGKRATGIGTNTSSVNVVYNYDFDNTLREVYVRNVRIPMKEHIWLQTADGSTVSDKLTKDFTKVPWGTTKDITVNFRSFLTNGDITITIEGDTKNEFSFSQSSTTHELTSSTEGKSYKVGANMCASANGSAAACSTGQLGKISNYDFKVYFRPQKDNVGTKYANKNVYVKITDDTSTAYVYLQGENDKRTQTIYDFSTEGKTYKTTDAIPTFAAYTKDDISNAKKNLPVTYSANPTSIATVESSTGVVTIVAGGATVTFTASQAGDTYYYPTSKEVTYTINKVNPTIATQPTVGSVAYLALLNTSSIANDGLATVTWQGTPNTIVAGTFSWTDPSARVEKEPGLQAYSMTFTPTDGGKFNTVTFNRALTVTAIDQSIVMNNGSVYVKVTTGLDANAENSRLDLTTLINSQTEDPIDANRDGAVTFEVISAQNNNANVSSTNITNNVFTATVCDTYTVRATKAATSHYNGQTADFTVEVKKRLNSLTTVASYDKYVDAFIETVATSINSNAQVQTSSTANDIARYIVAENKIIIPNENAASFNDTTVTIKIWQDATDVFAAGEKTLTLTVRKYDNKITIAGFDDNEHTQHHIKTDWYDNEITLTATNTNYSARPIYYERTEGDDTQASFGVQEDNAGYYVVYTGQNTGIVSWRVWQEENYKYKGAENTFSVKVVSAPCGCVLKQETWKSSYEKAVDDIGEWEFGGIGDTLRFELRSNLAAGNHMTYSLKTDGEYETPVKLKAESELYFAPVEDIALGVGEHNTTAVVFAKSSAIDGLNTDNPYVHNIVVTRKRWFKVQNESGTEITTLPKMERFNDGDTLVATFYVDFSTCDSLVKVASDYAHVTFSNKLDKDTASYNTSSAKSKGYNDTVAVNLYYYSNVVEEKEVTITIYTQYENKTLIVPVKTEGYIFIGSKDDQWTEAKNWNVGKVPNAGHDVIIESNAVVEDETSVRSIEITTGSVTITPTGGLTVGGGGIIGATKENLILKAGTEGETKGQTGFLRISPDYKDAMPEATIEMFTTGYYNMEASNHREVGRWQYIGWPLVGGTAAKTVFLRSMLYDWDEKSGAWKNNLRRLVLQPFTGYATSQYKEEGLLIATSGQLVDNASVELTLTYSEESELPGCNVFANSFTSPIDISKLEETDFSEGVEASIHMFNTGSKADIAAIQETKSFVDVKAKGQYLSIPVKNALVLADKFGYPLLIPSMQGFYVNTSQAGTLTLDYSKLVWNTDLQKTPNTPLRIRAREADDHIGALQISLASEDLSDNLFILESNDYSANYENGYDAHKKMSCAFNIFTIEDENKLAVDATDNIIGTRLGIRTGETTEYTLYFTNLSSTNELALYDAETKEKIDINEGTEYTFYAEPNSEILTRFQIVERANAPAITTDVENVTNGENVHKFIKDNQLYILKNGVIYNAQGKVVR